MTKFEQHIGYQLPQEVRDYIASRTIEQIDQQARKLKFDSWCPVVMENDSPELRKDLKQASDLLFQWIDFQSAAKQES
tara:strand:- start:285 stop:518 length:234 start_codon:yes stop_codon:yes gene_type:complete